MTISTLNLMDAYMIETLFSKGLKKEAFIQALKEDSLKQIVQFDDSFDYTRLIDSVKGNETVFEEAIENCYRVSYLTIGGLKNLLRLKYGFEEGVDFNLYEQKLQGLSVSENQLKEIKALVGIVWIVEETSVNSDETTTISILHTSLHNAI